MRRHGLVPAGGFSGKLSRVSRLPVHRFFELAFGTINTMASYRDFLGAIRSVCLLIMSIPVGDFLPQNERHRDQHLSQPRPRTEFMAQKRN